MLAVTLGLDVTCRLASADNIDRGWHRTATYGIFGAAATAAKLFDLNIEQTIKAFGIAYSQAAGNRRCIVDGALTKRLQAGQAASSGVVAAELAQEGFTGATHTLLALYQTLKLAGVDTSTSTAKVKVATSPSVHAEQFGPGVDKRRPSQVVEAQFSIPFLIAAALTQGKVGI